MREQDIRENRWKVHRGSFTASRSTFPGKTRGKLVIAVGSGKILVGSRGRIWRPLRSPSPRFGAEPDPPGEDEEKERNEGGNPLFRLYATHRGRRGRHRIPRTGLTGPEG